MAKYNVKVGEWVTPTETTGSIQNVGTVPIEISGVSEESTGIRLETSQMVNFEGTVFVRTLGNDTATFTTVPFKVVAGGGGGGGGEPYILPTASEEIKGGIKIGNRISMSEEKLSADLQVDAWKTATDYNIGDIIVYNNKLYKCKIVHTSNVFSEDINNWIIINSSLENWKPSTYYSEDSIAVYNNILYICNTSHTSSSTFDYTKWTKTGESLATKAQIDDLFI